MIKTFDLTKKFEDYKALDNINIAIPDKSIYGLVGSNGSGKSTLLRLISGIYYPDSGGIEVSGENPFDNIKIKDSIFHISDDIYFLPGCTMDEMAGFYESIYSSFSAEVYRHMCELFPLNAKKAINTFSKGMKRQAAIILSVACCPKYLLIDEAFDGLDPVVRIALRKILADLIYEREMTVVISSHNLRDLEDLCDHMGLIHNAKVMFEREIDEIKLGFCKVQAAFKNMPEQNKLDELNILQQKINGSVMNLIVKGNSSEVFDYLSTLNPLFAESIPLTLEEVFIQEMEAAGYDYNNIIF